MKKRILQLSIAVFFLFGTSSCILMGDQNQWPSPQPNPESERVYGNVGGEPAQLNNEYPDDETGEVAERAQNIRDKFFPN